MMNTIDQTGDKITRYYVGTISPDEAKELETTANTPPEAERGFVYHYYGYDISFPNGEGGDWYMMTNHDGSDCGSERWRFPPARVRKWTVDPNHKCVGGTKWRVEIQWGNP
jgi:hypothetical protein